MGKLLLVLSRGIIHREIVRESIIFCCSAFCFYIRSNEITSTEVGLVAPIFFCMVIYIKLAVQVLMHVVMHVVSEGALIFIILFSQMGLCEPHPIGYWNIQFSQRNASFGHLDCMALVTTKLVMTS